jgi:hypothetical protein
MFHELFHRKNLIYNRKYKFFIKTDEKYQSEAGKYAEGEIFCKGGIGKFIMYLDLKECNTIMNYNNWIDLKNFNFFDKIKLEHNLRTFNEKVKLTTELIKGTEKYNDEDIFIKYICDKEYR